MSPDEPSAGVPLDSEERIISLTPTTLAQHIAALSEEKLATDVVILDMRPVCAYTDFFVIATGANVRQTKAIYDEVAGVVKRDHKLSAKSVTGLPEATWILGDFIDVVLHVFTPETRLFYRLEDLWSDVPKLQAAASVAG
jgi:ribosome-associated protein